MKGWLEYGAMTKALAFSVGMESYRETDLLRCRVASFQQVVITLHNKQAWTNVFFDPSITATSHTA